MNLRWPRWAAWLAAVYLAAPARAQAPIRLQVEVPALGAAAVSGAPGVLGPSSLAQPQGALFSAPDLLTAPVPLLAPLPELSAAPMAAPLPAEVLAAKPAVFKSFSEFAQAFRSGELAPAAVAGASNRLFDKEGDRSPEASGPTAARAPPAAPKLPPGARGVAVDIVRTAKDIDRLIPAGRNSFGLISRLKDVFGAMAPYSVYTYTDASGKKFSAIDLSAKPKLIEIVPDLQDHERLLIMKIQERNADVQLLVREDGKTPDLIVGGRVVELKTTDSPAHLQVSLERANAQVLAHGLRHGMGQGAAAVDLMGYAQVPISEVGASIESFRRGAEAVVLDKIFVFAKEDLKVFVRQSDNSYRVKDSAIPFGFWGGRARVVPDGRIKDLERLAKQGRLNAPPRPRPTEATLEGERVVRRLQRFIDRKQDGRALKFWEAFAQSRPAALVEKIRPRAEALLRRPAPPAPPVPSDRSAFLNELEAPEKALRARGITETITVYGSARIVPLKKARKLYAAMLARPDAEPKALEEARRDVEMAEYYDVARRFGALAVKGGKGKRALVTGGGPGIMEAANRGAFEAGGPSVGFNIKLPHEQKANPYLTKGLSVDFENFSTRKMALRHGAVALAFFPGGFGTMDELFEVLTLIQTGKMKRVPIVLVGKKSYWDRVVDFKEFVAMGLIAEKDLELFKFAETAEQAWAAVEVSLSSSK